MSNGNTKGVSGRAGRPEDENSGGQRNAVERDGHGRFVGSGNPRGRPPKVRLPEPTSFGAALAQELAAPIAVRVGGQAKNVSTYRAIAKRVIALALTGDGMDLSRAMRAIYHSGAIDVLRDVAEHREELASQFSGPAWTPELEEHYRVLEDQYEDEDGNEEARPRPDPDGDPDRNAQA